MVVDFHYSEGGVFCYRMKIREAGIVISGSDYLYIRLKLYTVLHSIISFAELRFVGNFTWCRCPPFGVITASLPVIIRKSGTKKSAPGYEALS